ncbi:hypothetical protein ACFL6T_03525 [Candidatus Zixiibacteriota bacterium]
MNVPPVATGDFTITIQKSLNCDCSGDMSGVSGVWGDFVLTFTGFPVIGSSNLLTGEMTVTRYRAGIDTLVATAWLSGSFIGKDNASLMGNWGTVNGASFMADGRWGVYR